MAMKYDNDGFLVGERVAKEDITGGLEGIREEISALRRDVAKAGPVSIKAGQTGGSTTPVSPQSAPRDEDKRSAITPRNASSAQNGQQAPASANRGQPVTPAAPAGVRGPDGRFAAVSGGTGSGDDEPGMIRRSIDGLGDRLGGAMREASAGTEEADPAVKAFNEVAQPMQRGLGKVLSSDGDREQNGWYRRFYRMMRRSRRDDQTEGKRQRRILKNIERKPVGGGGGSMLWRGLLLLLAPLTGMLSLLVGLPLALAGTLAKALRPILRALGLNSVARRIPAGGGGGHRRSSRRSPADPGSRASNASRAGRTPGRSAGRGGWARSLGRFAKGGARRIPLIGGLLSAGFMASDVLASERSDATRAEKDKRTGGAVGSGLGGLGGMAAGASAGAAIGSVVPGIGTAIGGVLGAAIGGFFGGSAGEVIGEKVGGWVTELRDSNLIQSLTDKWDYATTFMGSVWEDVSSGISAKWSSASERVEGLWGSAKDAVTARWETVTDSMKEKWGGAVDLAAKGWESLTDALGGVNDWIKDKTGIDVAGAANDTKEWVSGKAVAAAEVAADVGSRVRDGAVELGGKIKDKAGAAYDKAADKVAGAAESAGDAVSSFWGSVKDKASQMTEGIAGAVTDSAAGRVARRAHNKASAEPALTQAMADAGITNPNEQAAFMGQMSHESGGFRTMEESFNYSSAKKVMAASKTARGKGKKAVQEAMAQGPEAVANLMYGGREDLGNTEEGDGYRFRGRGYTQLTGRDNYQRTGDALGIDLVNNPDLAKDPEIAAKIATHFWQSRDGLSEAAKQGDTREVTKLINGGTNGLADREARTQAYLAAARNGELNAEAPTVATNDEPAAPDSRAAKADDTPVVNVGPAVAVAAAPAQSPPLLPAGVSTPAVASVMPPRAPDVGEAPAVSTPLNSPAGSGDRRPASSGGDDVNRDLPDRRLAHIVTGGYSGMA